MVWAPDTGTFRLKLEDQAAQQYPVWIEMDQSVTVAQAWTELTFDLARAQAPLYDRLVIFPGWGVP